MPKTSHMQFAFNAGELSPRMDGRVDHEKYYAGCQVMENYIPVVQGPVVKRSGTRFVREVKDSADSTRLIDFEFSTTQAYVLEFGDQYMRVYMDGGIVLSGGSPYEIITPYAAADVHQIMYAQSADVLYLAHPDYPPQKVSRTGHTSWTITEIDFDWPAFGTENTSTTTMYASAATGSVTITASASTFTANDVGRLIKLKVTPASKYKKWAAGETGLSSGNKRQWEGNVYNLNTGTGTAGTRPPIHRLYSGQVESDDNNDWAYIHSGAGYAEITGYTSGTVVTATVVWELPDKVVGSGNATRQWAFSAWDAVNGYPRTVTFFEDRLWWGGTNANPQTLWGSRTGDYEDHEVTDEDESAVQFTINTDTVNTIEWMSPGDVLAVGTAGSEHIVMGANSEEAVSPGNVKIPRESNHGSKSGVRALRVSNALFYVQRAGTKLMEFAYSVDDDKNISIDTTRLSDHILGAQVRHVAYQREPQSIIWCVLEDGQLVGFTYERIEKVMAWHRHVVAGTDVEVESVSVIPHPDGDADQVWLVVKRTIDGGTKRYVEYIEKLWERGTEIEDSFFVDSGLTYSGAASSTISGLSHLEGEEVAVLADGATHPSVTVSSGEITLERTTEKAHVGLPYTATLQTMRIEGGANDGVSQGRTGRITSAVVRLDETGVGLFYGPEDDLSSMDEYYMRTSTVPMGSPPPLFSGDTDILLWPEGFETDKRLTFKHTTPLPCTITALMAQIVTQEW